MYMVQMSHKHKWVLRSAAYLLLQLCLQYSLYSPAQGETTVTPSTEKSLNSIQDGGPPSKTSPIYPTTLFTDDRGAQTPDSSTSPNLETSAVELLSSSIQTEISPTPRLLETASGNHVDASDITTEIPSLDNFTSVATLIPSESLVILSGSSAINVTGYDEPVELSTRGLNDSDFLSSDYYSDGLIEITSTIYPETTVLSSTISPTSSLTSVQTSSTSSSLVSTNTPSSQSTISTPPSLHISITETHSPTTQVSSAVTTEPTTSMVSVTMTSMHNWTMSSLPTTNATNALVDGTKDPPGERDQPLSTPVIIGIAFGVAAAVLLIAGVILFILRRRVFGQTKHDSSNYWDDNVTLSYINSHAEFPKDLDAEMMSLDDDSFLNSLDSMTFANLWATDTAKHTNF